MYWPLDRGYGQVNVQSHSQCRICVLLFFLVFVGWFCEAAWCWNWQLLYYSQTMFNLIGKSLMHDKIACYYLLLKIFHSFLSIAKYSMPNWPIFHVMCFALCSSTSKNRYGRVANMATWFHSHKSHHISFCKSIYGIIFRRSYVFFRVHSFRAEIKHKARRECWIFKIYAFFLKLFNWIRWFCR